MTTIRTGNNRRKARQRRELREHDKRAYYEWLTGKRPFYMGTLVVFDLAKHGRRPKQTRRQPLGKGTYALQNWPRWTPEQLDAIKNSFSAAARAVADFGQATIGFFKRFEDHVRCARAKRIEIDEATDVERYRRAFNPSNEEQARNDNRNQALTHEQILRRKIEQLTERVSFEVVNPRQIVIGFEETGIFTKEQHDYLLDRAKQARSRQADGDIARDGRSDGEIADTEDGTVDDPRLDSEDHCGE